MCLIGIAWKAHPKLPLVIAANRDEFHNRPSAAAAAWADHPQVFGGRDLSQKGSWLAVSTAGKLAAITNVRRMVPPDPGSPSRGKLVADFLTGSASAADYAKTMADDAPMYAGFNLTLYDGNELLFVTNSPEYRVEAMAPGIHTVSNASLDTPWPKAKKLHLALDAWCQSGWETPTPLFKALGDRVPAADADLPKTGIGTSMEKMLSAAFIVSPHYGTRCSTIVTQGRGMFDFMEHRFEASGAASGHTEKKLPIAPPAA